MMQSEFETLTGIYLDVPAYMVAEHEYNTGDWASKAEFCDCFKADEDGIATKVQKAANERWFKMEQQNGELIAANEKLLRELNDLTKRVNALQGGVGEKDIRAAMQVALHDAACDDNKADMILHMVWGFDYLLSALGVK